VGTLRLKGILASFERPHAVGSRACGGEPPAGFSAAKVYSRIAKGKNVTISLDCCIFAKATKAAFINDRKLIAGEAKNASSTWPVN